MIRGNWIPIQLALVEIGALEKYAQQQTHNSRVIGGLKPPQIARLMRLRRCPLAKPPSGTAMVRQAHHKCRQSGYVILCHTLGEILAAIQRQDSIIQEPVSRLLPVVGRRRKQKELKNPTPKDDDILLTIGGLLKFSLSGGLYL